MKTRSLNGKIVLFCILSILILLFVFIGINIPESQTEAYAADTYTLFPNGQTIKLKIDITNDFNGNDSTYLAMQHRNVETGAVGGWIRILTNNMTGTYTINLFNAYRGDTKLTNMAYNEIPNQFRVHRNSGMTKFEFKLYLLIDDTSVWSKSCSYSNATESDFAIAPDLLTAANTSVIDSTTTVSKQYIPSLDRTMPTITIPKASEANVPISTLGFSSVKILDRFGRTLTITPPTYSKKSWSIDGNIWVNLVSGKETYSIPSGLNNTGFAIVSNGSTSDLYITNELNKNNTPGLVNDIVDLSYSLTWNGGYYNGSRTLSIPYEVFLLPSTYDFTLDAGTGIFADTTSISNFQRTDGDTTALEVPTKIGYTFNGWKSGTTFYTNSQGNYLSGININDDISLVADYTVNNYTTTFAYQGATSGNSIINKSVNYDTTYGTLPAPLRTGYTFNGWFTQATGGTQIVSTTKTLTPNNHTVYAHWTALTYSVTYNYQGATSNNSTTTKSVTYDSTYGTLPTPLRTGYTFNGWYNQATGGTQIVSTTKVLTANNQTLYAHWTALAYSVTYNYQGATSSNSTTTKSVTYDSTYGTLPTPLRTGYTFNGWYNQATDGTQIVSTTKVLTANNQTLYAHWTALTYSVTYNYQGATSNNSTTTKSVTYDSTYGTLPTPLKSG